MRHTWKPADPKACHKDDPRYPYLCSCGDCCRGAAAAWNSHMDNVYAGKITLNEAQRMMSASL